MPTAVVLDESDEEFHFAHPDKDGETFCGESYSHSSAARVASFARYKDDVSAQIATEEDKDECPECNRLGAEWADE